MTHPTNDLDLVGWSLPAFPFVLPSGSIEPGLTKREWMAGMIACGYVANKDRPWHFKPEDDATWILRLTDIVLAKASLPALEQTK